MANKMRPLSNRSFVMSCRVHNKRSKNGLLDNQIGGSAQASNNPTFWRMRLNGRTRDLAFAPLIRDGSGSKSAANLTATRIETEDRILLPSRIGCVHAFLDAPISQTIFHR
jgi:hypothetical protein